MTRPPSGVEGGAALRGVFRGRRRLVLATVSGTMGVLALALALGIGRVVEAEAVVLRSAPFSAALEGQGRLAALDVADVGAESSGRAIEILADEGDVVEAGELLARIDRLEAESQLRSAEASAAAACSAVEAARSELRGAEAHQAELRDEYRRLAPLAGSSVSRGDVAAVQAAADRAEAEVARAEARLEQARAQAEAAAAEAATLRLRVEDADVRAPVKGVVVARSVSVGDMVAIGAPLFRVVDPGTLYVWAPFDESVLEELTPGLPATVRFHAQPSWTYPGSVARIGREVDPDTREIRVEIALDETPERWALGQRADVVLQSAAGEPGLSVPSELLHWREGAPGVYTALKGRARWAPVHLGRTRGGQVEITAGLQRGDTVLVPSGLRERTRVHAIVDEARGGS